MTASPLIAGLGHALLDIIAETSDADLAKNGLTRGTMALVENDAITQHLNGYSAITRSSGGAVCNTLASIAMLGGEALLVGALGEDEAGAHFIHDLAAQNVRFAGRKSTDAATGRCLVLVSENAERTMLTCLGASTGFAGADEIGAAFASARFGYLELYLFDSEAGRAAAEAAAKALSASGGEVVLNLSDPLCVGRHQADLAQFIATYQPLLIANEHEICAFFDTHHFAEALEKAQTLVPRLALTRSEAGSFIIEAGKTHPIAPIAVEKVVDSTGAGDAYAGGLLFALGEGADMMAAGKLASQAGAAAVQQFGARPNLTPALAENWRKNL